MKSSKTKPSTLPEIKLRQNKKNFHDGPSALIVVPYEENIIRRSPRIRNRQTECCSFCSLGSGKQKTNNFDNVSIESFQKTSNQKTTRKRKIGKILECTHNKISIRGMKYPKNNTSSKEYEMIKEITSSKTASKSRKVTKQSPKMDPFILKTHNMQRMNSDNDSKYFKEKEELNGMESGKIIRKSSRIIKKPVKYSPHLPKQKKSNVENDTEFTRTNDRKEQESSLEMNGQINKRPVQNLENLHDEKLFVLNNLRNENIFSMHRELLNHKDKNIFSNVKLNMTKKGESNIDKREIDGTNLKNENINIDKFDKNFVLKGVIADEENIPFLKDTQKFPPSIGSTSDTTLKSTKRKRKKMKRNDSFEKYGIILPSYDEIIEKKNRAEREAEVFDDYDNFCANLDLTLPDSLKKLINCSHESQDNLSSLLDCTHLTKEEIQRYFNSNLE